MGRSEPFAPPRRPFNFQKPPRNRCAWRRVRRGEDASERSIRKAGGAWRRGGVAGVSSRKRPVTWRGRRRIGPLPTKPPPGGGGGGFEKMGWGVVEESHKKEGGRRGGGKGGVPAPPAAGKRTPERCRA